MSQLAISQDDQEDLFSIQSLELAWRRAKVDRPDRCFVVHPYLFAWIETDLPGWLNKIRTRVLEGYVPSDCQICNAPKPGWMVRPGAILDLSDEVVCNAIVGDHHGEIYQGISWSQGDPDIAYQFNRNEEDLYWVKSGVPVWREWREKSLAKLEQGVQFVLFADISGFYENVDLHKLRSDLNSLCFDSEKLDLLMKLLNRWAQPRGKGIPQGTTSSDILAKIYLSSVDRALQNAGFKHLRYVDDIRIFCHDILEAKRALLKLNELLRNRGLNLQSSKTKIERVDLARNRIDGIAQLITTINEQLRNDLAAVYPQMGEYVSLSAIEAVFINNPNMPPPQMLERAFADHFSSPTDEKFDKTLFHYLLSRLGKSKSTSAVNYCLGLLTHRPDETEYVLRYFKAVVSTADQIDAILTFIASSEAIYDYQLYQIVKWFWEQRTFPEKLIQLCRNWLLDRNRGPWLRTYCVLVLGSAGDSSDLENIEMNYSALTTEIEKAEYVSALSKMEVGRRNSFYGRIQGDSELVKGAIKIAKNN